MDRDVTIADAQLSGLATAGSTECPGDVSCGDDCTCDDDP